MTSISRVGPDTDDAAGGRSVASLVEEVRRVADEATRADGRSPLNEATLLSLTHHGLAGKQLWVARDETGSATGFALVSAPGAGEAEANLVVAPGARGAGVGRALAEAALGAYADVPVVAWSHGNHPAAASLAAALGFDRVRDLWVMRRPLSPEHPLPPIEPAGGVVVRTFRTGEDEDAFLALNAEAFADHPEQGSMTRADLEERMGEPWFDPAGFFLAEPADAPPGEADALVDSPSLLGFHWTKVHDEGVGEVYVVGVAPVAQGKGLATLLTLTGLHHLEQRGLREVILYVEADNAPAIAVYSRLGFTHADADTDVMYARRPGA